MNISEQFGEKTRYHYRHLLKHFPDGRASVQIDTSNLTQHMLTILRNQDTQQAQFLQVAKAASSLIIGCALSRVMISDSVITTPMNEEHRGSAFSEKLLFVHLERAGRPMANAAKRLFPNAIFREIDMKRCEETGDPDHRGDNFEDSIDKDTVVILMDPMCATGGSALKALEVILERGASPENVHYAGFIAAPEGIKKLQSKFTIPITVAAIDAGLDGDFFIQGDDENGGGIGDFGDRCFGPRLT